jgi:RNA polymerase sigma-70 factor (ECF subfamily)
MEHVGAAWEGAAGVVTVERPFEEFFELEQERLLRVLWIVTGTLEEAEDIAQESFLRMWERWSTVSAMDRPAGYLHRTAMNVFRNRYRRARLAVRKAVGVAPPVDAFGAADDRLTVGNALAKLTPKQRAAVVLTDLLGYPAEEAARMLGVRGSTVRSLSSTARAAMRNLEELADD